MKKVLITGNSGYIGSHLTKMLKDEYEVHGLDIVQPQLEVNEHHTIDIRRMFTLDQEYDAVIHLAALVNVGESEIEPIKCYITNLNGTMNIINKIKTKNFVQSIDQHHIQSLDFIMLLEAPSWLPLTPMD